MAADYGGGVHWVHGFLEENRMAAERMLRRLIGLRRDWRAQKLTVVVNVILRGSSWAKPLKTCRRGFEPAEPAVSCGVS